MGAAVASIVIWGSGHLFPVFGKPTVLWDVIFGGAAIGFILVAIFIAKEVPEVKEK